MLNLKSQRGMFAHCLHKEMHKDKNIWLIAIDLGYGILDSHFYDYPDRCVNTGAAEQSAMDTAVGLTLGGKRVFVYSITPFLLYRPFETIRTYINFEKIPVQLIGSGRDTDYAHDGYSHDGCDDLDILVTQKNIRLLKPFDIKFIPMLVHEMVKSDRPSYLNLSR